MFEALISPELLNTTEQLIIKYEGMELIEYLCPAKKVTIGAGKQIAFLTDSQFKQLKKNADGKYMIDLDTAKSWLREDIIGINSTLSAESWYSGLNIPRKAVIIDLVYNLGMTKFKTFKNFLSAIAARDFDKAGYELEFGVDNTRKSYYYQQVPNRAKNNIAIIKTGKIQ